MGIIVTIQDKHLKDIHTIAKTLSALGMRVDNVLKISGIISGSIKSATKPSELKVKGVKSVEVSKKISATGRKG
jgi:hypothetical protein